MSPKRINRRVAVCIDKSRRYGRGVLHGIADYAQAHGRWSLHVHPRATGNYCADWLRDWNGDGVLAFIEDVGLAAALRDARIPAVELFGHRLDLGLSHVGNDEEAFGRLAADHLVDRRYPRLAFVGVQGALWSERRRRGFAGRLQECASDPAVHICAADDDLGLGVWEENQLRLARWLEGLPKPVGVLAASDRLALRVLDACRREGISVPEEVGVIGVDNDEEICRLADPPLTSVMDDARQVGTRAAALLDRLMAGHSHPLDETLFIPPLGIATRRSTEMTALEDPLMARACQMIRDQACEGLTVKSLVKSLGLSKTLFYVRFSEALNRHPHEEILRAKLQRARSLLRQTDLSVEEVAVRSGFTHPEYLNVVFKRELGVTPGQYRRRQDQNPNPPDCLDSGSGRTRRDLHG